MMISAPVVAGTAGAVTVTRPTASGPAARLSGAVRWSPHWRLDVEADGTPVVSAGGDLMLALRGVSGELLVTLRTWTTDGVGETTTPEERRLADRLLDMGALVRPCESRVLRLVGDDAFGRLVLDAAERSVGDGELAVVVRTAEAWPEPPEGPYVAVDCAYHHTVVFGPYVVPGFSACLGCLQARVARRWRSTPTPAVPEVLCSPSVVGELLRIQLDAIERGTSPLLNATIAWDLAAGTVQRDTLLKVPGCTMCDPGSPSGRLPLPWETSP